jgi:hypothetical protein
MRIVVLLNIVAPCQDVPTHIEQQISYSSFLLLIKRASLLRASFNNNL